MTSNIATAKKKKYPVWMGIVMFLFSLYFAFVIAASFDKSVSMSELVTGKAKISIAFNPLNWSFKTIFHENLAVFIAAFLIILIIMLFVMVYSLTEHDLIQGSEYGVADWGTPEKINRKFAAKDEHENRIYSENVRIGMDGRKTQINSNTLVLGGSGTGKSLYLLTPNLYNADVKSRFPGSFVITDPDGGLLRSNGKLLKQKGYRVRTINLISGRMDESDHINIMQYIRFETDINKISTAIWDNTTNSEARQGDQFFDNAAKMLLESIMLLVWLEHDRIGVPNNFTSVMKFINMAEVDKDGNGRLSQLFDNVAADTMGMPFGGDNHPAVKKYRKTIKGAEETVGSIIQTLHSRIDVFDNEPVKKILSDDNINLPSIGTGIADGKENVKTALFLVIPDADKTFNAVAGVVYSLLISELYFQADNVYNGELPIPVSFWFDEFANIILPDNFPNVLATMRKRMMSAIIIIQNMAQIKGIYKEDGWENIVGGCDTFVYLGGNEYSTFRYISENMGKKTIWKRSASVSRGSSGSTSQSDDVIGRELALPEEVRKLDNRDCIIIVRSQDPVIDRKFQTLLHPDFELSKKLGAYLNSTERAAAADGFQISIVKSSGTPDILLDADEEISMRHPALDDLVNIVTENEKLDKKEMKINIADIELFELLARSDFKLAADEFDEVMAGIEDGLTDKEIKSYILYQDAARMRQKRLLLKAAHIRAEQGGAKGF